MRASDSKIADPCGARSSRRARVLVKSLVTTGAALAAVLPPGAIAQTLIQRTITIDGNLADWTTAPNILTSAAQSSTDAVGAGDLDAPVQSTGRDLAGFAYTWDDTSLYLQVTRAGSVSNTTDWWFYIDNNANGSMQSGENVLRVSWQGSNRSTSRSLCTYTAVAPGGDPLVSPSTGRADGYDVPGTVGACTTLLPNPTGGDNTGLRMETRCRRTRARTSPTSVPRARGRRCSSTARRRVA